MDQLSFLRSAPDSHTAEAIDPANYIGPAGEIELSIKHIVFAPFIAFRFDSMIDRVTIEVAN